MPKPPSRHTTADHRFGADAGHFHTADEDHDHDHDEDPRHELVDEASRELEAAPFLSVGVDIGSATTQIVVSRLQMRGPGEPASLRRLLKSRETLWLSPIALTPWIGDRIDATGVRDIVDAAFAASGFHPDDIDTGAVILTGDAAADQNARRLLDVLSRDIGDLVSAVAGHHMEAMLAAWGSGAVRQSLETGESIMSVDMGGGTTKFAAIVAGRVVGVGALAIGSRSVVFDQTRRITRLSDAVSGFASQVGAAWSLGGEAYPDEIERVASAMAAAVARALTDPLAQDIAHLWLTEPLIVENGAGSLVLSGGVSEFAFATEERDFGDLGPALGRSVFLSLSAPSCRWRLSQGEGIRATVLGASEHSVQISGETCFISAPARLLPQRNLPVVCPNFSFNAAIDSEDLARAIADKRKMMDIEDATTDFALALRWRGDPDHTRLSACAKGVTAALRDRILSNKPLFLLIEGDVAVNLAGVLLEDCGLTVDLLALDGIVLRDFDWVDIGRLRHPSNTVPVTVKSLIFSDRSPPS